MPQSLEILAKLSSAADMIEKRELGEAAHVVEWVWKYTEGTWDTLTDFEAMHFLGYFATFLRALGQTQRHIKVLERLCAIGEPHLELRGRAATDDDIRCTGMDFVELGLAYLGAGRVDQAREAFDKAKYILEELGWLVEVDKLIAREETTIGPSASVQKRPYEPSKLEKSLSSDYGYMDSFSKTMGHDSEAEKRAVLDLAGQVAKFVLLESVADGSLVDPSETPGDAELSKTDLEELLRGHTRDCSELASDIPLLLGVCSTRSDQMRQALEEIAFGGLRSDQVTLVPEAELPALSSNGQFVITNEYTLKLVLGGGGHTLLSLFKDGVASDMWNDGVRWLVCIQSRNKACRIDYKIIKHLLNVECDVVVELTDIERYPSSHVYAARLNGKNMCIDGRTVPKEWLDELIATRGMVSATTGTFWIRIDKLAAAFGFVVDRTSSAINTPGNDAQMQQLLDDCSVLARDPSGVTAVSLPLWAVLNRLDMQFWNVGSDRLPMVLPSPSHPTQIDIAVAGGSNSDETSANNKIGPLNHVANWLNGVVRRKR